MPIIAVCKLEGDGHISVLQENRGEVQARNEREG